MENRNQPIYNTSLINSFLKKLNCEAKLSSSDVIGGKVLSELAYNFSFVGDNLSSGNNYNLVIEAKISGTNSENDEVAFNLSCTFCGEFKLISSPSSEYTEIEPYLAYLSANQLYPYMKHHIDSCLNGMMYGDIGLQQSISFNAFADTPPSKKRARKAIK